MFTMNRLIMKGAGVPVLLFMALNAASCSTGKRPAVDVEADTFLSEVRYIITRQEKKQFRNLPPQERSAFIQEFWKIRDPDPETEENEYKEEYYQRIDKANSLFRETTNGWLSDRGRIFILIGEPDRRDTYPRGYTFYGPPIEIWYYGFFTIVFVDEHWDGSYRLDSSSVQKLNSINLAQMHLKHKGLAEIPKEHNIVLSVDQRQEGLFLTATIPYAGLSFSEAEPKGRYTALLDYTLSVSDRQGRTVSEKKGRMDIHISAEEMLKENNARRAEFPLELSPGRYRAVLYLQNENDQRKRGVSLEFKVK